MTDNAEPQIADKENENEEPQNTAEDLARSGGWKPQDEWEGPKEDWRSAEVFNERGEWIQRHKTQEKRINDIESTFNQRMDNANKIHQAQLEMQKSELQRKRDEAIELADKETANKFQDDIDTLNSQQVVEAPAAAADNQQAVLDSWNKNNPWIFQGGPKTAYARSQLQSYIGQGQSVEQAIAGVDRDIAREFPTVNTNRDKQPLTEGGTRPGAKRGSRKLGMSDLTSEELRYYRAMPGAWKNEAEFLQAVQDTRGEK